MEITFEAANATKSSRAGLDVINLEVRVLEDGALARKYPATIQVQGEHEAAYAFAQNWVADNLETIPDAAAPTIEQIRAKYRQDIVRLLDAIPDAVLSLYPKSDPLLWDRYQAEAELFDASGGDNISTDYPNLTKKLTATLGEAASVSEALARMNELVPSILDNAHRWGDIANFVSGAQTRYAAQMAIAPDVEACRALYTEAESEVTALRAQYGL